MGCHEDNAIEREAAKTEFMQESIRAVGHVFGFPLTKDEILKKPVAERRKYTAQKDLYYVVLKDLNAMAAIQDFQYINPHDVIKGLADHLYYKANRTIITPASILKSDRRTTVLLKTMNKIYAKRMKLYKEYNENPSVKTIRTKFQIAALPPHLVMVNWDKYGLVSKVVKMAQNLSSDSVQIASRYIDIIDKEVTNITNYFKSIVHTYTVEDIMGGMDGIEFESLTDGRTVTIWERREDTNEYLVNFHDDTTNKKQWVSGSQIGMGRSQYEDALVELASARFPIEVVHGQIRYIIPSVITPQNKNTKEINLVRKIAFGKKFGVQHYINIGNDVYVYVLIKQGENYKESYKAYLIRATINGENISLLNGYTPDILARYKKIISEGWYRSDKQMEVETNSNTFQQQFVEFRRMKKQPSDILFNGRYGSENDTASVWDYVSTIRRVFNGFSFYIEKSVERNEKQVARIRTLVKRKYSDDSVSTIIDDILDKLDAESRVWRDYKGNPRTSNAMFTRVMENYFPRMFHKEQSHKQLDEAIKQLKVKLIDATADYEKASLSEVIENLEVLQNYEIDKFSGRKNQKSLIEARRAVTTKRRKAFTDITKIRKDNRVITDYISETARVLVTNDLVSEAIENIYKMRVLKYPENVIQYASDKIKQATSSPNVEASFGSYEDVAKLLNKLPKFLRRGRVYDSLTAKKLVIKLSTIPVMRFLGINSAIMNNTQPANNIIVRGSRLYFKALKIRNSDAWKNEWKRLVDASGVTNVINMFESFLLSDETPTLSDAGFIGPIPTMRIVDWVKMMRMDSKSFTKYGDERIDKFLTKIQKRFIGAKSKDIAYMRRMLHELATETSKDPKLIEARLKNLIGDVSDSLMKKMVSWKLSYLPGFLKGGESMLTFTGGEAKMREVSAIVDILHAMEQGILPKRMEDGSDPRNSDTAIRIMREASNSTMFGMNAVFQGMAFDGVGKLFLQFKSYALNQILFDYNTMESFFGGSNSISDITVRLSKAFSNIIMRNTHSFLKNEAKSDKYRFEKGSDPEAEAVIRFIFTRFMASIISTGMSLLPIIGRLARSSGLSTTMIGKVRGAENPMFGIPLRIVAWSFLMAAGYSDDDKETENMMKQFGDGLLMLTIPAIIGWLMRDVGDAFHFAADLFDD